MAVMHRMVACKNPNHQILTQFRRSRRTHTHTDTQDSEKSPEFIPSGPLQAMNVSVGITIIIIIFIIIIYIISVIFLITIILLLLLLLLLNYYYYYYYYCSEV